MEGQFNKIKKFKGALLALMVAVAASIPVTTGEFKDAYAAKIIPQNQRYERYYGYQGKQEYFFVSKGSSSPTVLRYTLTTATDGKVICSFEAYTEVTRNYQQNHPCRCWLSLGNLKLEQQNIAYVPGAACWHPNDETINKVYRMIGDLNAVYQSAHGYGLNFKAVTVPKDESIYAQDGYVVNGDFVTSLLQQNARWPSDWSRLYKQPVCPAVNRNHHQQQLAENHNQGNQPRQLAANLGQPNQQNQWHRQYQPNQNPVQQQFRQPAQQFNQNQQPHFNQAPGYQQYQPNQNPVQPAQQFNQFQPCVQPAANPGQPNQNPQVNPVPMHQQWLQNQFGQPSRPYNPNLIRQFLRGINVPTKTATALQESQLPTYIRSNQFPNYRYYLTDIRGSGSFGTVYGAILVDNNGQQVFDYHGQPMKYCIKIIETLSAEVEHNGRIVCLPNSHRKEERNVRFANEEISMMKEMKGFKGTNQFIEVFNQGKMWSRPFNVCIVQSDCGHLTLESLAGQPTDFENMVHIMGQILPITKNVHKQKIMHRDIKLENVVIDKNGQISLIDFGLARKINKRDNMLGKTIIGTPCCRAPEVDKGETYHKRADIWSIGCLFYMLLTKNEPMGVRLFNQEEGAAPSLNWGQFATYVQGNFRINGMPINESQVRVIFNFVSNFLNPNQYERPGMTNCIDNFIHMCSVLNINLESSLMDSLRNARSTKHRARH
jgi:serine/threonine protein kinase